MKSIYSKTLYQKRFMMFGWFMGITVVTAFTLAFFNSFSNGQIGQSLQSLPPAVQKLVGDVSSFTTISGYISQQLFALRMPLLLSILSIAVFVSVSASEEQQGIVETQLSLPISRTQLLVQKLAAALSVLLIGSLGAVSGVTIGLLLAKQHYGLEHLLPLLVSVLMVAVNFGLLGFAVASATGKRGLALGVTSGLAFGSYLIDTMVSSVQSLEAVDKFSLFHYYSLHGYNWGNLALLSGLATLLIALSIVTFNKRDIIAR